DNAQTRSAAIGNDATRRGLERAQSRLESTDSALADASGALQRLTELSVQLGSDPYDAASRKAGADEVRSLKASLLAIANSNDGGRYLFAGYQSGTAPFSPTGAFVSDKNEADVSTGDGNVTSGSVNGGDIFAGPVDIFAMCDTIATALDNNDSAGV